MKKNAWFPLSVLLLSAISLGHCSTGEEDADLARLQGDWVVVSSKNQQETDFVGTLMKFEKNTWQSYNRSGQSEGVYTVVLRPDKVPKEIDLTIIRPKAGKVVVQGIYSFGKDQLILAVSGSRDKNVRPKSFDAVIGGDNDVRVFVLDRKKVKQ